MKALLLFCLLLPCILATNPPVFPDQYTAHGNILLPYAEINEPFAAYYDGSLNRSRIDYYGDLMITLQKSAVAEKSDDSQFGTEYQIVYEADKNGHPKRVCFRNTGSEHENIVGQNVIPNLDGFTRIGTSRCPTELGNLKENEIKSKVADIILKSKPNNNVQYSVHASCELWVKKNIVGEKVNTYSFWYRKDAKTGEPIPVAYEMKGFNNLMGSHFDHYIVHYTTFRDGLIHEDLFNLNTAYKCSGFPGPGANLKKITMNPIKALFDTNRKIYDDHFDEYKNQHNKKYDTEFEAEHRRKLFLDNSRFVFAMNRRNPSYKLAINHLADKSEDELKILTSRMVTLKKSNGGLPFKSNEPDSNLPAYWDWRLLGAVNPVKDQAVCGSCWSFGTTGTLEGTYFAKTGKLVRLSEQQLVDCSYYWGNNGCSGGEDWRAYKYIQYAGGIASDEDYGHYLGVDGKCHANDVKPTVKISGWVNVTQYSPEDLKKALYENGPVTIAINAGVRTFSFYSHGIYDDPKCLGGEDNLNHQVLLVGYGTLNNKNYWLVKNSWSTYWGNDGYILIAEKGNVCGVTTMATYPLIDV